MGAEQVKDVKESEFTHTVRDAPAMARKKKQNGKRITVRERPVKFEDMGRERTGKPKPRRPSEFVIIGGRPVPIVGGPGPPKFSAEELKHDVISTDDDEMPLLELPPPRIGKRKRPEMSLFDTKSTRRVATRPKRKRVAGKRKPRKPWSKGKCHLTPGRICKSRGGPRSSRYNRKEVHEIARACGIRITDPLTKRSKTMTKLCKEISRKRGPAGPWLFKDCHLTPDRICKSRGGPRSSRFSRKEVHEIARACGIRITNPRTKRPKTMTQLCREISKLS